jgi:hypothetical protein
VSCKRCMVYKLRSVRKLFTCGVHRRFLPALPILTALKLSREEGRRILGY